MRLTLSFLFLLLIPALFANEEKDQKKALEQQATALVKQAKSLEKSGQLLEARTLYAKSQAFWETKDAQKAIKHIDDTIRKRVKDALRRAHKLYDQGQFKSAAETLENASQLGSAGAVLSYDLALCHRRLGDTAAALGYLDQAISAASDPKRSLKLKQLRTTLVTGEQPAGKSSDKDRINNVNRLIESIGFEASLDDGPRLLAQQRDAASSGDPVRTSRSGSSVRGRSSLCQALEALKGSSVANSPAVTFDLANCAEDNDHSDEASRLLTQYLQLAPNATDAGRVRLRIANLDAIGGLGEEKAVQVRTFFASASRAVDERKYDRALADFKKAAEAVQDFAPTQWRLALMSESLGNADQARQYFTRYRGMSSDTAAQQEADGHLNTLDIKRDKYDEEVGAAEEILSDLLNRAMNLTFNGLEDRGALYKQRARARKMQYQSRKQLKQVGGFSVPFAYAQQQLADAGHHLATALALCPLGAEANQLMGLVFLQANDGRSAMRSFDVVASQNLPVAFYAELRGRKQDHAVKCELSADRLQMIFLSSYDKKSKPLPPAKPAGEDGLGDLVIDPASARSQDFELLNLTPAEIKRVETKNGQLLLKLAKEDITLSPIYLPALTPTQGPPARRFANNYTRLFVQYPGLENSKLGTEGLTGGEKIKLAYDIANAGAEIAFSLNPIGAVSALQTFSELSMEIRKTVQSLHVNFASWEKTMEDQQDLQTGNAFKCIPTEPANTSFVEEIK